MNYLPHKYEKFVKLVQVVVNMDTLANHNATVHTVPVPEYQKHTQSMKVISTSNIWFA
jgi:hypothetical protein